MNAAELMNKIIASGTDESGVKDRFMGNAELYEMCFLDFLEESNFELLRQALEEHDYERAFAAAHALKGLSGNLGVSSFYAAVCTLVESLRSRSYDRVDEQYAQVLREREQLRRLYDGEPPLPEAVPTAPSSPKNKRDRIVIHSVVALFLALMIVGLLFGRIFVNFKNNVTQESASHLIEINYQLKLYIEEKMAGDWKTAHSVGDSIAVSNFTDDDASILKLLQNKQTVWQTSDMILYTANGYGIHANNDVTANDLASEMIDKAWKQGKYMSIIDSNIYYTIPVQTDLKFKGSRISAISVIQRMDTFLDDMGFSSFNGKAWMYLTDENGIVISRLTNEATLPTFNFIAITETYPVTSLAGDSVSGDELLSVAVPTAFMMQDGDDSNYVISTPINVNDMQLNLFYLAPTAVVNSTMNHFSRQLISLSMLVICVFTVGALLVFITIYRLRKRRFDKELLARDRMFDLLIANTSTAFALYRVNQAQPIYISANSAAVVGEEYTSITRVDDVLQMNGSNNESEALRQINETMRDWDGKRTFKSGYIRNDQTVPPGYFEVQLYPVDSDGMDYVGIMQDVTQAFEREQTTRHALSMAERANKAKSQFLSNMSHDIRTPMNAIVNMTAFAKESLDRPKQLSEYLQTISDSSDHLLRLINDVLDMSRIESGQITINSAPFNIKETLKRQVDIIRPLCMTKGLLLIADFDSIKASSVLGDQLKFSQIIMNLLSNAVKFTPQNGAVRFTAVEIPSLRNDTVSLRFTVEDNGIGIAPDYIEHIFEPFSRADNNRVSKTEGTGLGLSICHSYVTAMGGTISCNSEEGEGTIFTVELFFNRAENTLTESDEASALNDAPFLGKRCLVGEDNAINQLIARTMLEKLGFWVEMAADGKETLQKFYKSKQGTFDVIYLDIQMPVIDGYQAAIAIRESGHPQAKTIPIIAMTANVFAEDIEKARIAGMDGHLGKPIMSFNLIEETTKAINKKRGLEQ